MKPRIPKPWELREPTYTATLEFERPPSVNALTRNVPGVGRVKTRAYKDWLDIALLQINAARPGCVRGWYHIAVRLRFGAAGADLNNFWKAIEDCLVKAGVVQDDRWCASSEATWMVMSAPMIVRVTATKSPGGS